MTTTQRILNTLFTLLFMATTPLLAQNAHRELLQGDRAYRQGDYSEAEQRYRRAELKQPGSQSWYNLGNSIYQQKRFDEAAGYFRKAAEGSAEPALRSRALHNLGNAQLQQGDAAGAVEAYKQALRLRPGDADTRHNLALALRMQEAQKAEEQAQKAEEQSQNAGQQDQKSSDQDQRSEGREQSEEAEPREPQPGSGDPQPASGNRSPSDRRRDGTQQPGDGEAKVSMTKAEAEKLLQIMEKEEHKVQQRVRRTTSAPPRSSKDW